MSDILLSFDFEETLIKKIESSWCVLNAWQIYFGST